MHKRALSRSSQLFLPRVIGHRGALAFAPENTIASFHKAKQLGAKWVEFDVKESQDGTLLLMHDETLERTTNGNGLVAQKSWTEIKKLSAGEISRFSSKFHTERIPNFSETISALTKLQIGANIEIKPCPGREISTALAVAELVSSHWPSSRLPSPLISSFNIESLQIISKTHPHLTLGTLFEKIPKNWREILQDTNSISMHVDEKEIINKDVVKNIILNGYHLLAYTVNSQQRAKELFSWGVTAIFSDSPWHENY